MKKEKYNVTGMSCAACSARVEKAVGKLEGVEKLAVNLLTNSLQITYDEARLDEKKIVSAVEQAGYGASLCGNDKGKGAARVNTAEADAGLKAEKEMRLRLVWSIVFLLPIMVVASHQMLASALGIPVPEMMRELFHGPENAITFSFLQLLLVIPIMLLNRKYYINGFKSLWHGNPNMDSLVGMGSAAAAAFGCFAIFRIGWGLGHGDWQLVQEYSSNLYFESAGMIVTLITVGKYLETRAKGSTSEALKKIVKLVPQTAIVIRSGVEQEIPAEELMPGDEIIVKPGASVPADGIVLEGQSSVDEAALTGESMPVLKSKGDRVISAAINGNGLLRIRATQVGEDSTIRKIVQLVDEASASKAPIAKIADKIAGIFVPAVIGIAAATGLVWLLVGASVEFAFSMAISILVISCPCALGLATPVAIMVGIGKGAENGILIKSGEALETACQINTVVLDKTGTITEGRPQVTDVIIQSGSEMQLAEIALALEQSSEHPLAKAVVEWGQGKNITAARAEEFCAEPGKGICGVINKEKYYAGNQAYLQEQGINTADQESLLEELAQAGKTPLIFADARAVLGIIAIADREKESSIRAISKLKGLGLEVVMLTGDNQITAEAVAKRVGVDRCIAGVLPGDKAAVIREIQAQNKKVAMAGDGINDAPALMCANLGIAIGAGTDIAIDSADAVLMKNDLQDVVSMIELSRSTLLNIKENLFWAFIYNVIGIPLAAGVLYPAMGIKLSPMIGAAAMSLSSVCVVMNALRLKRFKADCSSDDFSAGDSQEKPAEIEAIKRKDVEKMEKIIKIEGMMCQHCQKHAHDALAAMDGVTDVVVDLENKQATVQCTREISIDEFAKVIADAGYEVVK